MQILCGFLSRPLARSVKDGSRPLVPTEPSEARHRGIGSRFPVRSAASVGLGPGKSSEVSVVSLMIAPTCPFRRLAAAASAASASAGTQGETLPRKRSTSASAARFEAAAVVVPPLLKQKLPDQAPPWPVLPARWRGNFYRRSSRRL